MSHKLFWASHGLYNVVRYEVMNIYVNYPNSAQQQKRCYCYDAKNDLGRIRFFN